MRLFRNWRLPVGGLLGALLVLAATGCSNSVGTGTITYSGIPPTKPPSPKKGEDDKRDANERPRQGAEQPAPNTVVPKTVPVAAVADGGWGTIKGQVVFGGDKLPKLPELNVDKDKKECLAKGPLVAEDWVMDPETKGLKWAIVWLVPDKRDKASLTMPIPIHPKFKGQKLANVVIDQPCCMFEPYCVALQEGQSLTVKNSMSISHNSKIEGDSDFGNPAVNPLIPPGAMVNVGPFKAQPTEVPITCSIHGWMSGHVRVMSHPYFVVTGKDGKFEIKDAPAGEFRLVIWHPGGLWVTGDKEPDKFGMKVVIKNNETTDLKQIKVQVPK